MIDVPMRIFVRNILGLFVLYFICCSVCSEEITELALETTVGAMLFGSMLDGIISGKVAKTIDDDIDTWLAKTAQITEALLLGGIEQSIVVVEALVGISLILERLTVFVVTK